MQSGFYYYRNKVYYGSYDANQVSGWVLISGLKPEDIATDEPVSEGERAVSFFDNHCLLEQEYKDLQTMLTKMRSFMNVNSNEEIDFSATEKRLGVSFPKELKLIYNSIIGHDEYFTCDEHFLPLDEIYTEQGIIVFYKKKKIAVAGYDTASGCLAQFYKKEWKVFQGDFCCYQFCIGSMLFAAMENKPVFKKGRCKGSFVTTLNIAKEVEKFCNEKYSLLSEFDAYGVAVMYSDEKLIAWIRSNGFYSDIQVGAVEESHIIALGECLGNITWK